MPGYKFSMEKILNLREKKEKTIIEDMGQIQNQLRRERKNLSKLEKEAERDIFNDRMNVLEMQYNSLYKDKIKEDIDRQNQLIDSINNELEMTRDKLIEAQKDRKVMEKLKEKDREKFEAKIKREEQKQLDEIAVLKFNEINPTQ